jgi:hypothetical protein
LSPEKQLEVVRKNPTRLKEIKNPTEAAKMEAVRRWPRAIRDIKNPSDAVQLAALKGGKFVSSIAKDISSESASVRNSLALRLWHEFNGNVSEEFLSLFTGDALFLARHGLLEKESDSVLRAVSLGEDQVYSLVKEIEGCFPNPNKVSFRSTEFNSKFFNWCLRSTSSGLSLFARSLIWEDQLQVPAGIPATVHKDLAVKSVDVGTEYEYGAGSHVYNRVCSVVSKYIKVPVHSISVFVSGSPSSIKVGRSLEERGAYDINVFINVNYV